MVSSVLMEFRVLKFLIWKRKFLFGLLVMVLSFIVLIFLLILMVNIYILVLWVREDFLCVFLEFIERLLVRMIIIWVIFGLVMFLMNLIFFMKCMVFFVLVFFVWYGRLLIVFWSFGSVEIELRGMLILMLLLYVIILILVLEFEMLKVFRSLLINIFCFW